MALPGSRADVLRAVHEQAQLLSTKRSSRDANQHAWTPTMWHAAFEYLFYTDPQSSHDDLLFFVLKGSGNSQEDRAPPYTLQRRTAQLPAHLGITGSQFNAVDWAQTVLLNLVLQANFQLAVVKCRSGNLPRVAEGLLTIGQDTVVVSKTVYASPARTTVNIQTAKAHSQPVPAYPDIYFHIDDFDGAFADVVLHDHDDCFCVVLRALPMLALEGERQQPADTPAEVLADRSGSTGSCTAQQKDGDTVQQGIKHLVLFSGYVVHKQIEEYLGDKLRQQPLFNMPRLLGRLFSPKGQGLTAHDSQQPQRHLVLMNGPAGIGRAEVAVAAERSDMGLAVQHANPLQQGAVAVDVPGCALQCALMSVSLPVGHLTATVLQVMLGDTPRAHNDTAD